MCLPCRLSLNRRVSVRVQSVRRILHVDTQHTRRKLIVQLEELFEIASNYARGVVKHVTDENGNVQQGLYTRDGFMLTDEDGKPLTSVKIGDTAWEVTNPRKQFVVQDPAIYHLSPLSAYDEMKNRLMKIKDRFRDAPDADEIVIAAENTVAYDKIVQLMDIARMAEFPNISIAKLRS